MSKFELTWWDEHTKEKYTESIEEPLEVLSRVNRILDDYGRLNIKYKIKCEDLTLKEVEKIKSYLQEKKK